jgi:hypothetical protein
MSRSAVRKPSASRQRQHRPVGLGGLERCALGA